jgi:LmbE family N-acetylglucosaminyl deacetylase
MHLFLSPHADDAVFSCGGWIAMLVRRGEPVMIYTVMAGHPPEQFRPTAFTDAMHARWGLGPDADSVVAHRHDEDAAAAWALGARVAFGPYSDAPYRVNPVTGAVLYTGDATADDGAGQGNIFGAVHPDDPLEPGLMAATIAQSLAAEMAPITAPTALYAPLGVGGHVDHQLCRDMGLALAEWFPQTAVYFYAEYPYTRRGEPAIQQALLALSAGRPTLTPVRRLPDADAIAAKIKASACYRSQIGIYWADEAALSEDLRAVSLESGGEAYWHLIRSGTAR